MSVVVRPASPADAAAACAVHADGVATGMATFREAPYEPAEWLASYDGCLLVADDGGEVLGWAGVSRASNRAVYVGCGLTSVYVAGSAVGRGVGRALMTGLVAASEVAGFWTLWGHAFADNAASIALHRAAGFRHLGVRERVGLMTFGPRAGEWRDVVVMERRSAVVGVEVAGASPPAR